MHPANMARVGEQASESAAARQADLSVSWQIKFCFVSVIRQRQRLALLVNEDEHVAIDKRILKLLSALTRASQPVSAADNVPQCAPIRRPRSIWYRQSLLLVNLWHAAIDIFSFQMRNELLLFAARIVIAAALGNYGNRSESRADKFVHSRLHFQRKLSLPLIVFKVTQQDEFTFSTTKEGKLAKSITLCQLKNLIND